MVYYARHRVGLPIILEKVFLSRMMSFVDDKKVLSDSQYGFRKTMSASLLDIRTYRIHFHVN